MTAYKINTKTIARIAAIQVLYQCQLNDDDIDTLVKQTIDFYQDEALFLDLFDCDIEHKIKIRPHVTYLQKLVKASIENITSIDQIIIDHLARDKTTRDLQRLLLALLRVAVCERLYFLEIPRKVVINEYTDIASEMLAECDVGFVNSILDNITNKM